MKSSTYIYEIAKSLTFDDQQSLRVGGMVDITNTFEH